MKETVAVLGAGTMGRGIAQVAAMAGHTVWLYDPYPAALEKSLGEIRADLQKMVEKGRWQNPVEELLGRIQTTQALEDCARADLVIEAAPEKLELKQELLGKLSELNPQNILATNTSTFSVTAIAAKVKHPERVLGLHFFNPAQRMRLVEVVGGLETAPALLERMLHWMQAWGKEPVKVVDAPGFLVNRVARPFYGEALRLYGEGTPKEHIDWIMRGLGFPMGPFELMDLIGLDVNYAASSSVYQSFYGEPRYRPHPLQYQRVAAGMLGRKTGQGWYRYPPGPPPLPDPPPTQAQELPLPIIIGPNPLAKELRARFRHTENVAEARFVLDCRVMLERKHDFFENLPVVSLVWGHSASSVQGEFRGRAVAGFSLVPPIGEKAIVELFAPLSGVNEALKLAQSYFTAHGHTTLLLPDQPGGVGFRILALLINEAVSALAEGVAGPDDLNRAMRLGTGYPLGPLEWAERIWLKPVLRALEGLHAELGEDRYRPHPLLRRMVAAGLETFGDLSRAFTLGDLQTRTVKEAT
ncbi:MAG: 3-hydroxyacyl-CoA dehydrogenase NAD-binding domain-containing protein [Meiothermus sp.]|uniref:3-hydroxyacyl-CoA dehydrogenase NAD-binding domain-containing protein n=1 Tax=Meiothermus sp. TaxID=1955249 RepID=UPI0025FDDC4D|nr:3-hydroxyacyl-CoA dehydrogenase NAD-binding domain-containing protein [Meiothermus sp.]MCS7068068.1 3-hydroxyacyl-CoA dehydrogenase NAD-binding domain-containing protein [Meiothermus sp.]